MWPYLQSWLSLVRDRRAVTVLEYALIAGLVGVVIAVSLSRLGSNMSAVFRSLATSIGST